MWVSPATNWTYDIEEGGPPKVEVEFKMEDRKIKFKAEWENGELKVKIQEDEE